MAHPNYPNIGPVYPNLSKSNDDPPPYPYAEMGVPPPHEHFTFTPSAPPLAFAVHTVNETTRRVPGALTHFPQRMTCPNCHSDITTDVIPETGMLTHVVAFVLCLVTCVTCCCPCCLIPYCVGDCKDSVHVCPQCKRILGVVKRL